MYSNCLTKSQTVNWKLRGNRLVIEHEKNTPMFHFNSFIQQNIIDATERSASRIVLEEYLFIVCETK